MRILYNNYVEDATITASSEATDYTFSVGLNDDRLSRVCRTTSDSSQYIDFDLGADKTANYICITGHNLTSSATVTLYGNSVNDFTNYVVSFSIPYADLQAYKIIDTDDVQYQTFKLVDESANYIVDENGNNIIGFTWNAYYRYWRITIDDSSNPDGYIEISKIYLGDYLQVYMDTGISIPHSSSSQVSKSVSGQLYGNRQLQYKAAKFTLSDVDKADIIPFWNTVDIVKPFWLIIWEEDTDIEPVIYCSLTKSLEYVKQPLNGNLYTVGMEIEEVF